MLCRCIYIYIYQCYLGQSLAESAAAAEAKRAKPEYQEVELTTGEEEESNVIQVE